MRLALCWALFALRYLLRCQLEAGERLAPLFEVLYEAGVDKASHPEIGAAEQPLAGDLLDCVRALTGSSGLRADSLATAIEAAARGFALLLVDGDFGTGAQAVEWAAEQAARTTMAIVSGRDLLSGPTGQGPR